MTSNRGQNVSVLQRPDNETWEPSIAVFTDTGGSLRSSPRNISLRINRNTFGRDKRFDQNSSTTNFLTKQSAFRNRDRNSIDKYSNAVITNSIRSSSTINSINRELSPVRWCDREVDGVYLGRSGWVQVQQRSLDDCKGVLYNADGDFSTLPSRKNHRDSSPNCRFDGKTECERPLSLSLSTKKRIFQDNREGSSKFIQEIDSASPPSVTPIISPPPAFKDDGSDAEFLGQSIGNLFFCKKSFLGESEAAADSTTSPSPQINSQEALNSFFSVSSLKHRPPLNQALYTKSTEGDLSQNISCDRGLDSTAPLTLFGFQSLDNNVKITEDLKVSVNDSFYKNFVDWEKKNDEEEEEVRDIARDKSNKKTVTNRSFLGLQSSSWEGLNEQRFLSKPLPQSNSEGGERRDFADEYCDTYRTRSSSLDSNSSSTSSSCSSNSFNYKKFGKKISQKTNLKQSMKFKTENIQSKNRRHFNVRRSKSLQLSEKNSSNESLPLNNSLNEKSWSPVFSEHLTFQIKNQNNGRPEPFPQRLHHVLVTVNGESIPVVASGSLNKITPCGVERKKLFKEMEKEAKIISDFMNGSRSRTAARNLLMDRYFNRPENGALAMKGISQKDERDDNFLSTKKNSQSKRSCPSDTHSDVGSFNKKSQLRPRSPDLAQRSSATCHKTSTSFFQIYEQGSCKNGSCPFIRNNEDRRKAEQVETRECERSRSVTDDYCSDRKRQNLNFPLYWTCVSSRTQKEKPVSFTNQSQKLKNAKKQNTEKLTSDPADLKYLPKTPAQNMPTKKAMGLEKQNFSKEMSLLSSSTSNNICPHNFNSKFKKSEKNLKNCAVDSNSKTLHELCRSRPGSAPERDRCISEKIDKRSFSLPRSFLSECYRLNDSYQRNLLALKQQHLETSNEVIGECLLYLKDSQTAPTTPVRDVRFSKSTEGLNEISNIGSPGVSLFGETSFFKSRRSLENPSVKERSNSSLSRVPVENPKCSAANSEERNIFPIYKSSLKVSANSSETVLRKFKKKLSLKHLNAKEHLKSSIRFINQESEDESIENSNETFSVASGEISSLSAQENNYYDNSGQTHRFIKKKILKNEKYDSHDSGIQIPNRGNVDSSESQDTDIQEDVDSPLATDLQRPIKFTKQNSQKIVRRSNSDLGDERLFNWNVKNYTRNEKTLWKPPNVEDSVIFNKYEKFFKPRLRRSLSQPLRLNESPPSGRRRFSILKELALSEDEQNLRQKNIEDEFLSDSESLSTSLSERKKSFDFTTRKEISLLAEAVWDHVAMEPYELPFKAGDVIEILDTRDRNWWWGAANENVGCFPSAFVRLRVSQTDTVEDCLAEMTKGKSASKQLRRGKSLSLLSNDQVRSRIVRELLTTERDFVKILRDVKEGYVVQCKLMTDMFTSAQIATIFSNLEELLVFQEKFLKDLEARIDREFPYKSCVGEVFLSHVSGFRMYSEYCNSHPMAIATLQDLYRKKNYCTFFERCRLKQSLTEIPLDGYLLTPVQRICKYPLQLGELLKYTRPDHPDHKNVEAALETMRSVATLINERKRRMESLEKLAAWQQRLEGWEGEDLIEISSRLIHQGDVVRITSGMWTSRISLEGSDVIDLPDGKNQQLGVHIKYGLKISSRLKDKWLVFCCRSIEDKLQWLEALAKEKRLVAQDKEKGLDLPTTAKQLAKMAARTKKSPPCKPKGKNKFSSDCDLLLCRSNPSASKSKSTRRMGTWFTFGGVMKSSKASLKSRASVHRFT